MVYTVGLAELNRRTTADCRHCGGQIVWDEEYGWLHLTRWYACRWPATGVPREVMAAPHENWSGRATRACGSKAFIQITERRNLHCLHCFVSSDDRGEPFVNPAIMEICTAVADVGWPLGIAFDAT